MTRDRISDLFTTPAPPKVESEKSLGPLAIVVLVGVLGYVSWQRWVPVPDKDGDRQEQIDDGSFSPGYLIFVHELQAVSPEKVDLLEKVDAFCKGKDGLEWRSVDKDDPSEAVVELIAFAKSKGVEPPCVIFRSGGKSVRAAKWPTEAELKGLVK